MMKMWVLGVLLAFIVYVQAIRAPNICDTTIRTVYDDTFSTFDPRIECEGSQFRDSSCSSYWMRQKKLLRAQLTYQLCQDTLYAPYFSYAGPGGVFYTNQLAASALANATGDALRASIVEELTNLRGNVTLLWTNLRQTLEVLIDQQWSDTRAADHETEQTTRDLVFSDYGQQTRDNVSITAADERAYATAENTAVQNFDTDTETAIRAFVDDEHSQTKTTDQQEESTTQALVDSVEASDRLLWDVESTNTTTTITLADDIDSSAFQANNYVETSATLLVLSTTTSATQTLVNAQEAQTITAVSAEHLSQTNADISADALKKSTTITEVDSQAAQDRTAITNAQATVVNAWATLSSTISGLAAGWLGGFNQTEIPTFINLLIHLDLQSGSWTIYEDDTFLNQRTPTDLFQRDYFTQFRAAANDTITYNKLKYGSNSHANSYWSTGESYRNSGDYRNAAKNYRIAYRYAVTPGS